MYAKLVLSSFLAIGLMSCGGGLATNQQATQSVKRELSDPSSLPPQGYISSNWTDSRGCQYTSIKGSWVPMVTRGGSHMCNGIQTVATTTTAPVVQTVSPLVNVPVREIAVIEPTEVTVIDRSVATQDYGVVSVAQSPALVSGVPQSIGGATMVQVGTFSPQSSADRAAQNLKAQGFSVVVKPTGNQTASVLVLAKPGQSLEALLLQMQQHGYPGAVIVGS